MTDATMIKTVFLAVPRETAWAYLTEADKLAEWFMPAEADLVEGADYALMGTGDDGEAKRQCWGKVLEMDAPSKLRQTFTITPMAGVESELEWTLEAVGEGTRITLKHSGLGALGAEAFGLFSALDAGWDKHFASLRGATSA